MPGTLYGDLIHREFDIIRLGLSSRQLVEDRFMSVFLLSGRKFVLKSDVSKQYGRFGCIMEVFSTAKFPDHRTEDSYEATNNGCIGRLEKE